MSNKEQFYFGIPLIGRSAARDWGRVASLLQSTLRSILAQTDPDFRVIVAGHERPSCWGRFAGADERLAFVEADWPAASPTCANNDGGRKKRLIMERVLRSGGGLLMYCDADDLVDRRTVELGRALIGTEIVGGLVRDGVAMDARSGRALPLPDEVAFDGAFHELCGSSTIARVKPGKRLPHDLLGSHHQWQQTAEEKRVPIIDLPLFGGYHVNSGENHSENQGRYSAWRRHFSRAVAERGRPLTRGERKRLGLAEAGYGPAARAQA